MSDKLKLNLGSGKDIRDEYINVDIRREVTPDLQADITKLPFQNGSVREIIAQDVVEHFWNVEKILSKWYRVLDDEGILIIRVPDWKKLSDHNYWKNEAEGIEQVEKHVYGGHKNGFDQHHTLWTRELTKKRLRRAGFDKVGIEQSRTYPLHWHLMAIGGKRNADITKSHLRAVKLEID